LDDLRKLIGFDALKFNENNCYNLVFDEKVTVEIAYIEDDQSIVLSSVLGIPEVLNLSLYEKLLRFNMHWKELRVFTAPDSGNGSIVQFREVPLTNFDLVRFQLELESFVNTAEELMGLIEQFDLESQKTKSSTTNSISDKHFADVV
jgi:hypothetical protein